jgi:hypothetical protein
MRRTVILGVVVVILVGGGYIGYLLSPDVDTIPGTGREDQAEAGGIGGDSV